MDLRCTENLLLLLYIQNTPLCHSYHTLSAKINDDTTWLMSELNTRPVQQFNYEFNIEFPSENCCPILDIYHRTNSYMVDKECFTDGVKGATVWFKNKIHFLEPNKGLSPYDGNAAMCTDHRITIRCKGAFRMQDFEPKKRYFILGYLCSDLNSKNISLQGLKYEIKVTDESNITTCEKMQSTTAIALRCAKHIDYVTLPNYFGDYSQMTASVTFDSLFEFLETMVDSLFDFLETMVTPCYKYLEKAVCIALFPPCKNVTTSDGRKTATSILSPCKETCNDFVSACYSHLKHTFVNILFCEYFALKHKSDSCYHIDVECKEPTPLINGYFKIIKGNSSFLAGTIIKHFCDKGYKLEGLQNSTCLLSGEWSSQSQCIPTNVDSNLTMSHAFFIIGTPLLITLKCVIVMFVTLLMRYKRSKIRVTNKKQQKRNRENDAFISYYSDESSPEQTFVRKVLSPKLEREQEDPFKLLIHERDFKAGTNIVTNIMNAIKHSNAAIILLSQNYVDSRWCRDEFEWCVEEWKKDPAFELYVILMEPEKGLERLSDYMEQYLSSITYLKVTDPDLVEKIIDYLSKIRTEKSVDKIKTSSV